jgi:hypothetical protein
MAFDAAIFDELTPIYPDTDTAEGFSAYETAGCNGTYAGAHIAVTGLIPGIPLTAEVNGPHRCFKLFELIPVPVEVNCGAKQRTAYLKNDVNENVIRRAPFMVYEALEDFYNILTPKFAHTAIAFKTPIEYCEQARERVWEITLRQGQASKTLTLKVREFPSDVPQANENTFKYVNWFDFDRIAEDYRCEKWSPKYFKAFEQYLRAAIYSRQNTLCVNIPEIFSLAGDGCPVLNEQRLDAIVATAKRVGIALFHGGAFVTRKPYLTEEQSYAALNHAEIEHPEEIAEAYKRQAFEIFDNCTSALVGLTGQEFPGAAGEETLRSMASQLHAYIEKNGLAGRWYQNCLDEPNVALAPAYRRICEIVKAAMPGIPILEPNLDFEGLEGTMDIWCPSLDQYEQNLAFYNGRAALGEKIWIYSCLTPAANYLNRLLDMERLRQVWIGWASTLYPEIEGFLHWGANYSVSGDLFKRQAGNFSENSLEFHPKHAMFLPAGDTAIFFPGKTGPMISTRSEAHRIGLEDLHLLGLLKEKAPEKLAPLVAKVFRKFNDFEKDVAKYRALRLELLELL